MGKAMTEKTTLTLPDCMCVKREFAVPAGWTPKSEGLACRGDRWWRRSDMSWQPVGEHAFLGVPVGRLQAVIEPCRAAAAD